MHIAIMPNIGMWGGIIIPVRVSAVNATIVKNPSFQQRYRETNGSPKIACAVGRPRMPYPSPMSRPSSTRAPLDICFARAAVEMCLGIRRPDSLVSDALHQRA